MNQRTISRASLALTVITAAVLAGCTTLGPDFKAPDAAAPATFKATPAAAAAATRLPEDWWTLLGDAQLTALERDALAASPTLAAAQARAERARALLAGVRADDAYTYGLFRDCGIVILLRRYPAYQGILAGANLDRDMPFTAVEQAALPTDHTVVGCLLAQNWWLPGEIWKVPTLPQRKFMRL